MLVKLGWKLITDSNAFVSYILKSKYFPQGDFLNAKVWQNPSYTWKSIFTTREILQNDYRWLNWNGGNISVWNDPCLKDPTNFKISSTSILGPEDICVYDLFIPGHLEWDIELLGEKFNDRDVREIMSIFLFLRR